MPFVIDASIAACWLMPDEGHTQATAAYNRLVDDHALVPSLWWFEMRNLFIVNERRGRLDSDTTALDEALARAARAEGVMMGGEVLRLVRECWHSLAEQRGVGIYGLSDQILYSVPLSSCS